MKKVENIQAVLGSVIVFFLLVIAIGIVVIGTRALPEGSIITKPPRLTPREHEIEVVEDLFIPFEYQDGSTFTFVMTENFTTLTIVLQPDRTDETTSYTHTLTISNATITGTTSHVYADIEQNTIEFDGFVSDGTYTLYFEGGCGVATAS